MFKCHDCNELTPDHLRSTVKFPLAAALLECTNTETALVQASRAMHICEECLGDLWRKWVAVTDASKPEFEVWVFRYFTSR
jgi:hypothetical protein